MPENDLELLIRAARASGEIALKYWKTDHKTWDKGDGAGPVTEADFAVDEYLKETLLDARPDHGWLSEETEDTTERLSKSRVFVIDPIDGTRSFVAGERTWAHSLALVEDGRPIAGVIYLPATGKLYAATTDRATLDGNQITPGDRDRLDGANVLAPRTVDEDRHWQGRAPRMTRHFRPSLAYRMALVAEGRFDAMITLRGAWEWDIAAGTLIAEAAGAVVSDRRGKQMKFNSRGGKLDGVLMANPAIHRDLKNRLR